MAVLGTTLAGALGSGAAVASAVGAQSPHPRRGESILNVSTDMRAFRMADMTPDDPGVNATAILNDAIRLAAPNDVSTIIANQGTYYFPLVNNQYVVMKNVNGLTIDLQGSTLIFQGTAGNAMAQASALLATNCTALTLRNFSIDYDPLPFSQYSIVAPPDTSGTVNYFNGTQEAGIDVLQKAASDDWICLPNDAVTVQANLLENCSQFTGVFDTEALGAILVHSLNAQTMPATVLVNTAITVQNNYVVNTPNGMYLQNILTGSTGGNLVQLASPPAVVTGNGFTPGSMTADTAIQIAVSPVGGAVGDPVVPGGNASAALLTNAGPPAGALTFLMVDRSGASFTPVVTGIWPNFQFVVPSTAVRGVAGIQISASGTAVARGGMFVG
jgi:hypothetical protein